MFRRPLGSALVLLSLLATALPGLDTVTCTATVPTVTEGGGGAGVVVITRTGTGAALTVTLTTGGTATPGQDFQPLASTVTIPAGASSVPVYLFPVDDGVAEPTETVTVTIAATAAYTVGSPAVATVSILDDEPATVSVVASTANASEAGPTPGVWTISRTGSLGQALTVPLAFSGTATAGADFLALPNTATLAAGVASTTVTLTPIDDALAEPDETVTLTLGAGTGAAGNGYVLGASASATVTIADNEAPVVVVVASDATAAEPGSDTGQFRLDRLGLKTAALSVPIVMGGTATNGTDDQTIAGPVVIPANAASATVTLTPLNDTAPEPTETATLTVQAGSGFTVGTPSSATVTIADDEPVVSISTAGTNVAAEPNLNGLFTLTRTGGSLAAALTVTYTVGGTATPGTDYVALSGTATFPANAATVTIPVTVIDDTVAEAPERVDVTLVAGAGYGVGPTTTDTVWIRDNETALSTITVTASDGTMSEPGADTGTWTFTRSAPTTAALTISYGRIGTAAAGLDYTPSPISGNLTFPAGVSTVTVTLTPINDATAEPTRTATATILPSPYYLVGSPSSASITQLDDDTPVVTINATDASAGEPGTGLGTGQVTVSRVGSLAAPLTVSLAATGTAIPGSDYATLPATVTIPANATSTTVTVSPLDDTTAEPVQTVIVTVAPGSGYAVGSPASATVTRSDDDQPVVSIQATDPIATEGTGSGDPAVFTVSRIGNLGTALSIPLSSTGTASNGVDYATLPTSISIPAGAASATVTLTTIQDALVEGNETATVTLGAGTGFTVGVPAAATATIVDDEPVVSLAVSNAAAQEGGVPGAVTLRRTGSLASALTVTLGTSGTAVPGTDYTVATSATFPIGVGAVVVPVVAMANGTVNAPRPAVITLTANAAYAVAVPASGTVQIVDADPTPPTAPSSVWVRQLSGTAIGLQWYGAADPQPQASGIAQYAVWRNGIQVATTTASTWADAGLALGTGYSYQVQAIDGVGNRSPLSAALAVTTRTVGDVLPQVTNVTATLLPSGNVAVTWTPIPRPGITYTVVRQRSSAGPSAAPVPMLLGQTTLAGITDTALGGRWYSQPVNALYTVYAQDGAQNTAPPSAPAVLAVPDQVASGAAVAGLQLVQAGLGSIEVRWAVGSADTFSFQAKAEATNFMGLTQVLSGLKDGHALLSGLTPGNPYLVTITPYDEMGNAGTPATLSVSLPADTTPPPKVDGLTLNRIVGGTTVELMWFTAIDNVQTARYDLLRNGVVVGSAVPPVIGAYDQHAPFIADDLSQVAGFQAGTSLTYQVQAVDEVGNRGPLSDPLVVAIPVDPTLPQAPIQLQVLGHGAHAVDLGWWILSTYDHLVRYEVLRNGVVVASGPVDISTAMAAWPFTWSDSTLNPGTYDYQVRVVEGSGNRSPVSATCTVRVDAGAVDTTPPTVPGNLAATTLSPTRVRLTWTASTDASGPIRYQVQSGWNRDWVWSTGTSVDLDSLPGTSFQVMAVDAVGNASDLTASVMWGVLPPYLAPPPPANVRVATETTSATTIAWDPVTGGRGPYTYFVWDGISGTTVSQPSITVPTSDLGLPVSLRITTLDGYGTASETQATISYSLLTSALAPTLPPAAPSGMRVIGTTVVALAYPPGGFEVTGLVEFRATNPRGFPGSYPASLSSDGSDVGGGLDVVNGHPYRIIRATVDWLVKTPPLSFTAVLRAKDVANRLSSASDPLVVTATASIDQTPPQTPAAPVLLTNQDGVATVAWNPAIDPGGSVAWYEVQVNGKALPQVLRFPVTITAAPGATGPSTVAVTLVAIDAAGNRSLPSPPLALTLAAPSVANPPRNLRVTASTATTRTLAWDLPLNVVGITSYYVTGVNGSSATTWITPPTITVAATDTITVAGVDATYHTTQTATWATAFAGDAVGKAQRSLLQQPVAPWDPVAWADSTSDYQYAYGAAVDVSRTWDVAEPGPGVPVLQPLVPVILTPTYPQSQILQVQGVAGTPVSFAASRSGLFGNGKSAVTVIADASGVAQVTLSGLAVGRNPVFAASPACSGRIAFQVLVAPPAGTASRIDPAFTTLEAQEGQAGYLP